MYGKLTRGNPRQQLANGYRSSLAIDRNHQTVWQCAQVSVVFYVMTRRWRGPQVGATQNFCVRDSGIWLDSEPIPDLILVILVNQIKACTSRDS